MSQSPANEQLSAYLDGELDDAEAAALEEALRNDAELRAELETLEHVQRLLRAHGPARAPDGFALRLMERIAEEAPTHTAAPWWRKPFGIPVEGVLIAAAAALVLIVALPRGSEVPVDAGEAGAAAVPEPGDGVADAKADGVGDAGDEGVDVAANADDTVAVGEAGNAENAAPDQVYGAKGAFGAKGSGTAEKPVDDGGAANLKKEAPIPADSLAGTNALDNTAAPLDNTAAPPPPGTDAAPGSSAPILANSGVSVSIHTTDREILLTLQRIVGKYSGQLQDAQGNPIEDTQLLNVTTELLVQIPATQASAFTRELDRLSDTVRVDRRPDAQLSAGSDVRMPLSVTWVANGSSGDADQAPKASKRAAEAADQALEDVKE